MNIERRQVGTVVYYRAVCKNGTRCLSRIDHQTVTGETPKQVMQKARKRGWLTEDDAVCAKCQGK